MVISGAQDDQPASASICMHVDTYDRSALDSDSPGNERESIQMKKRKRKVRYYIWYQAFA